jgi:hypothetical protein
MKKSYRLYYNKTKEHENFIFGDDLKVSSFFKMKHLICKESVHLKKFIFNNIQQKKMWFIGETFKTSYKNFIQKFICM